MINFIKLIFGIIVVIIFVSFSLLIFEKFVTEDTIEIEISNIEKNIDQNGVTSFMIYTKNEIFDNRDNYFHSKNNALNLSKILKEGRSYKVKVVGYNFGFKIPYLIEHRNILEIINNKSIILN